MSCLGLCKCQATHAALQIGGRGGVGDRVLQVPLQHWHLTYDRLIKLKQYAGTHITRIIKCSLPTACVLSTIQSDQDLRQVSKPARHIHYIWEANILSLSVYETITARNLIT